MRMITSKRRLLLLITLFALNLPMIIAQKVSINSSNQKLRTVLEDVTKQAGYSLAFSKEAVNLNDLVSINAKSTDIKNVLNELLSPRKISYEIKDSKVYLWKNDLATDGITKQNQQKEINISGTVVDKNNEPIIGATISVPGTNIGTITDIDGNYTLTAPRGSTLRFSYVGYNNQVITINNQTKLNVILKEDTKILDELVVIGYGAVKKQDLTTSVSSVNTKDLTERPVVSAAQAIQGKAAGVQVVQPSGQPGQGMVVRVRGNTSITASNDPLYVVDGVPTSDINFLAPNDIESMQILKDASSAAIYGSRASNGVVLITTKQGKIGLSKISLNSYIGTSKVIKQLKSLNVDQYRDLMNEIGSVRLPNGLTDNTDWFAETYRPGLNQNYQLSVTSGNDNCVISYQEDIQMKEEY